MLSKIRNISLRVPLSTSAFKFGTLMSDGPRGTLSVEQLKEKVIDEKIQTITMGFPDLYGRFLGKKFDPDYFLESVLEKGGRSCTYLLASDFHNEPIDGMTEGSWESGLGDHLMIPDLRTLREAGWMKNEAALICDLYDEKTGELVETAPRTLLRKKIKELDDMGIVANVATELEFFMYKDNMTKHGSKDLSKLVPISPHNDDYLLLSADRIEDIIFAMRVALRNSGIPVECAKGEAGAAQHEINVKYCEALEMADRHLIYKHCLKKVAHDKDASITFMAKPHMAMPGNGCHVHISLIDKKTGKNIFDGTDFEIRKGLTCSNDMLHFLGGWTKYVRDIFVFFGPTVNSYKRFQSGSWAPVALSSWSHDNRTTPFRIVGSGKNIRIEGRFGGADANPYHILAGILAAGIKGIKEKIEPPPMFKGSGYKTIDTKDKPPQSLTRATDIWEHSEFIKEAFGETVQKDYALHYKHQVHLFEKHVTDWEFQYYFDRI